MRAKLPAKKQPAAAAALEQRLKELGYRPDPAATPVVTVSLDPQVTKNTPYLGLTNLPYQHQPLRTQFKFGAKTVFEQAAAKEPPGSIFLTGGETLEQRLAREAWGTPDYDGLRKAFSTALA